MECPTPCYLCGEIVELDSLRFYTDYCDCGVSRYFGRGCSHGICEECDSDYNEEDDDDK